MSSDSGAKTGAIRASPARLVLRLFGPPRIDLDGIPLKLSRRKAIALLAYLAVTGQRHRRESLVNLLWPDLDSARGRAALRRTLHTLKNTLTGAFLDADHQEVGLSHGADIWLDVHHFQSQLAECETHGHPPSQVCPVCVTPLTGAVALVRGDFVAGFSLKDSLNFDDWQVFQTEALRRELGDALKRLVRWHAGQRKFEAAVGYARRWLALDPLNETAHRQLMRLHAWSGQRSAALSQYEQCVAVLQDQLGVAPQEATSELYRAIKDGHPTPPPVDEPSQPAEEFLPHPSGPPIQPPPFLEGEEPFERPLFVARERELAQLDRYLGLALAGQGQVVFVTGDVGCGKTALIQEFAQRAQAAQAELVVAGGHGNAHTGVGDPYLPFREILDLLTGDVQAPWAAGAMTGDHARRLWNTLPAAAQALVDLGPDLIDTFLHRAALLKRARTCASGGADWLTHLDQSVKPKPAADPTSVGPLQSDLFEQYTKVLQALAQRGPLLLVVDDLQWADLGSISLLFHLGRQLAGSPILIVGAYRPEEVALGRPEPWTGSGQRERHPLEAVVHEFQRAFGDIAVNLGQAQSRVFVEALLDSEPNRLEAPFREMLYRQTRGHPLFTIELLRGMQERGDLVRDPEGCWDVGPALDWETLPARVEAAIAERIGRLAQPLRALLRVASVEGDTFTAEVVARVLEADEREVVRRLSGDLDRRHRLVRAEGILRVDPARSGAKGGRRLSHYRFRHILFQKYLYSSLDEVERPYLHEAVGNTLETFYQGRTDTLATIAGRLAWHFQEAGLAERAVPHLRQAGESAVRLCAYQEAIAHLTRGLALLGSLPDTGSEDKRSERAQLEFGLQLTLGMAWIGHGSVPPEVGKAFARARELGQRLGKTSQLCVVLGELSIYHYVRAEYQPARELAEEALGLARRAGDPLLEAQVHWHLGFILLALGEFTSAQAHLGQTISFYDPQQHHHPLVLLFRSDGGVGALVYDACCQWALGFPEQALNRSNEALALARELGHSFALADALSCGCMFNEMRREPQALKDSAEELIQLANEKGFPGWVAYGICERGIALAMEGQFQKGMAQMQDGHALRLHRSVRCYQTATLAMIAEAHAQAGQPRDGLTTLDEALALVEETGERIWEAEIYRVQGELLLAQGADVTAEASLQKALEVARRQSAKSWELRATTSLARLWQAQGRTEVARRVLAEIYDWFTEGFDTADLHEAKALLEELK